MFSAIIGQRIIHQHLERITIINHVINTHPRRIGHLPVTGSSNPAKGWINQRRPGTRPPKLSSRARTAIPAANMPPALSPARTIFLPECARRSDPCLCRSAGLAFHGLGRVGLGWAGLGWVGSALLCSVLALPCLPRHSDVALATLAGLDGRDAGRATCKSPARPSHGLAVWRSGGLAA